MSSVVILLVAPIAAALAIVLLGGRAIRVGRLLALTGPVLAVYTGVAHLMSLPLAPGPAPYHGLGHAARIDWFPGGAHGLSIGYAVDTLSAVMLLVVGVVAGMVVVYSFGYMAEDDAQPRYFALLSLFTAAMAALVVASSLVGLFAAWELVGACSYLLIGFWFRRPAAANAAMKAFLVTRVGDVGLLIALAILWAQIGTLDLAEVMALAPGLPAGVVSSVALLLFVGAAGKSAQFPLHVWLPDAMEGPTPVSALIHAATMVAAGVFLIARTWPVFQAAPGALAVILVIGVLTAFGAALMAVTQTDIKKVLAYSTISQLGFMFAALGAGQPVVALFHLVTHAAFKSLLFLAAGSVIHGSDTQDVRELGGLARFMPVTAFAWVVGAGALAGLPPLSGFFSKDGVLHAAWSSSPVAGIALFAASALTAFYVARTTRLVFFGIYRGAGHPHESPPVMTAPLIVLAVATMTLGMASGSFASALGGHGGLSVPVALVSSAIAVCAVAFGWSVYARGPEADTRVAARAGVVWHAASSAFGADAVVAGLTRGVMLACGAVEAGIERLVIDGAVRGVARALEWAGGEAAEMQSGETSLYAAMVGVGAVLMVALALWLGR